jgi:hypothetical protein
VAKRVESMVQVLERVLLAAWAVDFEGRLAYLEMACRGRYLDTGVLPAEMVKGVTVAEYLVLLGAHLE